MKEFQHHVALAILGLVALIFAILAKRAWRLRNIPGPLICRITDLLRVYHQAHGHLLPWLTAMHEKYGSVLCIGPNCVSVSDPTKVPQIYTMHGEFRKADSYHTLRTWSKGVSKGSVIDMQDEKLNADMKRALRGAFAAKNVLEYDHVVDKEILALKTRLQEDGTIGLMETFSQYQVDFMNKVAFGQTTSFLADRTPTTAFSFMKRLLHWHRFQGAPDLESWLFQSWLSTLWRKQGKPPEWMKYALAAVQSRRACKAEGGDMEKESERPDLLDKYIRARSTHPQMFDDEGLLRMVTSTVSAGFDSTPFTMNNMVFYLCKNPGAYAKLKEEIVEAYQQGHLSEIPKWTEVNKLPYLDAVMKEAMRLAPFLNILLDREVPPSGTEVNGYFIPGGTTIGCHSTLIGRDRAFYGPDADSFRPERWFSENRVAMERNSLVFGSGKRMCIGLHIAELEIKKTIPVIMRDFEMSLFDPNMELVSADGVTSFPKSVAVQFFPSRPARLPLSIKSLSNEGSANAA